MERLDHFKQVLTILPDAAEVPTGMLILSAGEERGNWSFRHLTLPGRINYFIFKKGFSASSRSLEWECVDPDLDGVMKMRLPLAQAC